MELRSVLLKSICALIVLSLTGCVANWAGDYTVRAIKESKYTITHKSVKPTESVTQCLASTLSNHKIGFLRPYEDVVQNGQMLSLRKGTNIVVQAATLKEQGELVFVIENVPQNGNTITTTWVSPWLLMSTTYLSQLDEVVQTCL
jgi:hypothetical protein